MWLINLQKGKRMKQSIFIKSTLTIATLLTLSACGGSTTSNQDEEETRHEVAPEGTSIIHNGTLYGTVVSPYTGRVWLDRNLGAERVCISHTDTACYGDLYQFGRDYDGHQDPYSETTKERATDIDNAGYKFVVRHAWFMYDRNDDSLYKISAQLKDKWKRTDGSSVCPPGFYVPTISELNAELGFGDIRIFNVEDAFTEHFLKVPASGYRRQVDGELKQFGTSFTIWTTYGNVIYFGQNDAREGQTGYSTGGSIRCIKKE